MFILPNGIKIENVENKVVELEKEFDLKIYKTCENHCDFRHNTVTIEVYPKGKTHPFDKVDAYVLHCRGANQAGEVLDRLNELLYWIYDLKRKEAQRYGY